MRQKKTGRSALRVASATAILVLAGNATAATATHPAAEAQALELAKKAISLRSVQGPGNQAPQVAALFEEALIANGWQDADVTITPIDDTAYLIARWPGKDPKLKPLVILGHMDVVEAKPADWQRDPFTPVVENGYLFGRGASDMKFDAALAIASLGELRRSGYKPRRTIILEFSGDEETTMKTSEIVASQLRDSEVALNTDYGNGVLDETTGLPKFYTWAGAEKLYADFELSVTNPGGHSSQPRKVNAINELSAALVRIGNYQFKPELNELSKVSLEQGARYEEPGIADAMRAFSANPADEAAIRTLTDNPATVGKIRTTCVTTTINGGHARNALPQRATANINCRIYPGHPREEIMAELEKAAADPAIKVTDVSLGSMPADASPMRPDLIAAIEKAVHGNYPGIPVFPIQSAGATDCAYFRHVGVPCYGISPVFAKHSDSFSHGLNERVQTMNIQPGINYYLSLIPALTR